MLNRWQGNTGKVRRIDEGSLEQKRPPDPPTHPNGLFTSGTAGGAGFSAGNGGFPGGLGGGLGDILGRLGRLVPGTKEPLDNDDIILLLILYLMYRESGDRELLIMMGAMLLG